MISSRTFAAEISAPNVRERDEFAGCVEHNFCPTVPKDHVGRSHLFAGLCESIVQGVGQVIERVYSAIGPPGDQSHDEMSVVRFSQSSFRHRIANFLL